MIDNAWRSVSAETRLRRVAKSPTRLRKGVRFSSPRATINRTSRMPSSGCRPRAPLVSAVAQAVMRFMLSPTRCRVLAPAALTRLSEQLNWSCFAMASDTTVNKLRLCTCDHGNNKGSTANEERELELEGPRTQRFRSCCSCISVWLSVCVHVCMCSW